MVLDIIALASLAMITWLGYRKGFARQIIGFVAVIAIYFLATPIGSVVRSVIFSREGISFPGIETASLIIAAILIFLVVWGVGRLFIATITSFSESIEDIDMMLGGILGFIKGFLIVYLVLCALVYAEQPLGSAIPALGRQMESSYTIAAARHVNIITQLRYPELDDLRDAMVAAGDGEDADRNEALARLMENEDFQSLVADEDMRQAAADKDYSYMLSDERVLRLLADEDFRTVLTETDWDELIDD